MKRWSISVWQNLRNRIAFLKPHRARVRRRQIATVAAQVEGLESRELLTVTFHGGAVLANVEAQAVYLGADWKNTASLQTQAASTDRFLSTLVQSPYMDMLTNAGYNVGRGSAAAGAVDNLPVNKAAGITDAQIRNEIQSMITSGQLQAPDANRLYVVYVEPGVVVQNGSGASNTAFLGYHGAFGGKTAAGASADIHYAVIPSPGSPNFTSASQGFASDFDEITSVTSHELAEAVTDPNVNYKALGWYDDQQNGEIGDLTRLNTVMSGYLVQDVVNQNDQPISPSAAPSPTPTPPPSSTLSAPQNVVVSALTTTAARLSWGSVSGTQGYRVFQVNGAQSVLLGTVSATTTSVQINGLTAGARESFKVEAYNSTTTADSQVVSVTMPSTQAPLPAPGLVVAALSSTSDQLRWDSVAAAQGYRIYRSDGSLSTLLGTVGPSTTSIQVVGLTPGSTSYFMVEAFNGSQRADSPWVAVRNPFKNPAALAINASLNVKKHGQADANGQAS